MFLAVLAAMFEKIPLSVSIVVLEMLVAHWAVQFVLELGIHYSIFECDLKIAINTLNYVVSPLSSIRYLVKDIESIAVR